MIPVEFVFPEGTFLVTSQALRGYKMFNDKDDRDRFIEKVEYYLSPLCEIIEKKLDNRSFAFLVKLKSQISFDEYYFDKLERKGIMSQHKRLLIRDITLFRPYIKPAYLLFGQAISNLLNSHVRYSNIKYKRKGGMMVQNYKKHIVLNENEVGEIASRIRNARPVISEFAGYKIVKEKEKVDKGLIEEIGVTKFCLDDLQIINLQGQNQKIIKSPKYSDLFKIFDPINLSKLFPQIE